MTGRPVRRPSLSPYQEGDPIVLRVQDGSGRLVWPTPAPRPSRKNEQADELSALLKKVGDKSNAEREALPTFDVAQYVYKIEKWSPTIRLGTMGTKQSPFPAE